MFGSAGICVPCPELLKLESTTPMLNANVHASAGQAPESAEVCICTTDFTPVCNPAKGITYGNECEAVSCSGENPADLIKGACEDPPPLVRNKILLFLSYSRVERRPYISNALGSSVHRRALHIDAGQAGLWAGASHFLSLIRRAYLCMHFRVACMRVHVDACRLQSAAQRRSPCASAVGAPRAPASAPPQRLLR
jgi:hypothetical protein